MTCNSSSRASGALLWPPQAQALHVHRHTHILISKKYVLKNKKKGFNEYRQEGWKKYSNCGWGDDSLGKNNGYASSKAYIKARHSHALL